MKMIFLLLIVPLVSGDRIVTTKSGPIRGTSIAGKKVEAFLGIPYAEPPVGELRFAKPVSKTTWEETYDANKQPPACIQVRLGNVHYAPPPDTRISEDCLYLNMWVPNGGSRRKPIMVFIHGGSFLFGSINMKLYDGAVLSEHGDVIVATINYRLGTLGFFSGFIDEAKGSMGIYDQIMAIQWIKDNAKYFRGDPDNIVLMGESSGSYAVSLHMISPLSKNLFKRGILQSGSAYSPLYTDDNRLLMIGSQAVASETGCSSNNASLKDNPEEVVACMKRLPAQNFSQYDLALFRTDGMLIPRIGDDFLPLNPIDLYKTSNFENKDVLIGFNTNEGTLLLTGQRADLLGLFGDRAESVVFNDTSAEAVMRAIMNANEGNDEIFQSYLNPVGDKTGYSYLDAMSDFIGDYVISCGAVFQADFQSKAHTPVYFYMFDFRPSSTVLAEWMGVSHFEELQYVFGNPMYKDFTKYERNLSKDVMSMWAAFAKRGNPTIRGGIRWPRYTVKNPKYYIISRRDSVCVRPDNYRCDVWKKLFRYGAGDATTK